MIVALESHVCISGWCGNSYCGSTYTGLTSLIHNKADELEGKSALIFSYGSGLAATMFSLKFREAPTQIRDTIQVQERLDSRTAVSAEEYSEAMDVREKVRLVPLTSMSEHALDTLQRGLQARCSQGVSISWHIPFK